MRDLTGGTKIRLSQVLDFQFWSGALTMDARKYQIGEISTKTGLQKCLVNGRIVWLMPSQKGDFNNGRLSDDDLNTLLKSCKKARASSNYGPKKPTVQEAINCYYDMKRDWTKNPVKSPFFKGAKIRLDQFSDFHFTHKKGGDLRKAGDIVRRGYLITYVRDILERSGKPAEHTVDGKNESYCVVGKANIKGVDKGIKVIVSRHTDGRYYYFSVMDVTLI